MAPEHETAYLPNLTRVPFGREHAAAVNALAGCDTRELAPRQRFQYRMVGSDPTQGYRLPDGRVMLVRSRQMTAISDVVIFATTAEWDAWRAADGRELTDWRLAPEPEPEPAQPGEPGPVCACGHLERHHMGAAPRICAAGVACDCSDYTPRPTRPVDTTVGPFTTLLTPDGYNPKTDKGHARNYATAVLYLAPSDASGVLNVCGDASIGCRDSCLYRAGRGGFDPDVPAARINRTRMFLYQRFAFNARLVREIQAHIDRAARKGMVPCVRLNGTSDLPWDRLRLNDGRTVLETFPDVQFYDYTKSVKRALMWANGEMPANYHVTFSRSETNELDALRVLRAGGSVAVVFNARTKHAKRAADALPETYLGYRVVDADTDDLRFLDPSNVIAGLRAKGPAKKDTTGFVVDMRRAA